jgi:DNA polymerase III delta prime subunit
VVYIICIYADRNIFNYFCKIKTNINNIKGKKNMSNLKDKIWVAKYAPEKLSETIMTDEIKIKMIDFVKTADIPNILFAGPPGTGKTSTGKVLLRELNVDSGDIMFVNASDINSIDAVRQIIKPFAMSMSINQELPIRFVFLDEADHLSPQAQAALRNLIESSYDSARFILTANYPKKIIPALHSRLQTFTLEKPELEPILERVLAILDGEQVEVESEDDLVDLIRNNSSDIRKLIQLLQQNTVVNGDDKILRVRIKENEGGEVFQEYIKLFKKADAKALRTMIFQKFTDSDAAEFWTLMIEDLIKNSEKYETVGAGLDNTIYHLNEGQKHHEIVANKQLNVIGFTLTALDIGE